MTKDKVLHAWFSQFLPSYPAASVPSDAIFPWLTYDFSFGAFDTGQISLTVNLWYYTESEAIPNAKAQEISSAVGYGGLVLRCDGGYIRIMRGVPWCQSIDDESDKNIKRRYLNLTVEYLTEN